MWILFVECVNLLYISLFPFMCWIIIIITPRWLPPPSAFTSFCLSPYPPPPTFSLFKRATNASLSHLLFLYVDCRFQFWIICITMFTIFAKSKMWIESTDFAGNGNRFEMVFSHLFLKYILHSEWILKHNKICMILSFLYELINFSNQFEGVSFVVICSCAWVKRGSVWN